jgi:hypothetical protein
MYKGTRTLDLNPLECLSFGSTASGIMIARRATTIMTTRATKRYLKRGELLRDVRLGASIVSKNCKNVKIWWLWVHISVLVNQTEMCAMLYIRYWFDCLKCESRHMILATVFFQASMVLQKQLLMKRRAKRLVLLKRLRVRRCAIIWDQLCCRTFWPTTARQGQRFLHGFLNFLVESGH